MKYTMDLPIIHQILMDVAGAGEALGASVKETNDAAVHIAGSFGDIDKVRSAFDAFRAARSDVGDRISSVLFRKASGIATAAEAFKAGDSTMETSAGDAMTMLGNTSPKLQGLPDFMLRVGPGKTEDLFRGFNSRPGF